MQDPSVVKHCREKYLISQDGRVFSLHVWNDGSFRELKQEVLQNGYHRVTLQTKSGREKILVHILVLETFIGPRPTKRHETRHLDGNRSNNNLSNLMWGTKEENIQDSILHGTFARGSKNGNAKLAEQQVKEIRMLIALQENTYQSIAKRYNVTESCIANIATRSWKHVS